MAAVVLGLGAAVLLAAGFVLQQHAAEREPLSLAFSPRLLLDLVRRPIWLCGIAAMTGGDLLAAAALGRGTVALVEPLLAANLFFALPLSAAWHRSRLRLREWSGAGLLVGGLSAFVVIAHPHGGAPHATAAQWWIVLAAVVAFAALLLLIGRHRSGSSRAVTTAAAAGTLFGLQDTLTSAVVHRIGAGLLLVLASWHVYLLIAIAIVGILLTQSAFEMAPLGSSLPALTAMEPIAGIWLGLSLFHEQLRIGMLPLVVAALALCAMALGIVLLGRSPVITRPPAGGPPC